MRWLHWLTRRSAAAPQVQIAYAPKPNGRPDPGEVAWAWVPYEDDPRQGKDRPVLLIGRAGRQLLAVPLTSQDREGRRDAIKWVEVGRGAWDRQARPSHANASRLLRYSPRQVRREGATLPRDRFDAVVARTRQLHPGEAGVTPVDEAAAALRAGGVVVLPTDTVYGLVALASDASATAQLFLLKQRAEGVPLAVLCSSRAQALALAADPDDPSLSAVTDRWWPGPLTLVVRRRPGLDLHLGEPATTIGLRVPDHELVRAIAELVGPLAATSANRHGEPVAATASDARETFGGAVALVVDGGRLADRSSTVMDATGPPWRVLREGPIRAADIFETTRDDAG